MVVTLRGASFLSAIQLVAMEWRHVRDCVTILNRAAVAKLAVAWDQQWNIKHATRFHVVCSTRHRLLGKCPPSLNIKPKTHSHPTHKPKFCPKWEERVNIGLGEGRWALHQKRIMITTIYSSSNFIVGLFHTSCYRRSKLARLRHNSSTTLSRLGFRSRI